MTAPAPAPRKANTQFGQPLLFAGYASGDLLTSKPTLLKDRFIYVIEKRSNAPARLHMELHTSPEGELLAGPPDRRFHERDPQNRDLYHVNSPVPWTVEGKGNTHFFFASPTRLVRRAIAALESAVMTPDFAADWVDFWQQPPPRGRFFNPSGHPPVLVVTDPLTIATKLQSDYERALDAQLSYTIPPHKSKAQEANTIRSRVLKYELAQLINHYLLPEGKDPFNIRKEFADMNGDNLRRYIQDFESTRQGLEDQVDATSARLIDYLESPQWALLAGLHTYCKEDIADWLEFAGRCMHRLGSCPRGAQFTGKLYTKPPSWLAATGITGAPLPPEGEASEETETLTFIARKAAAGVSEVWVEVIPAAIAIGKTSVADALDRIDRVYRRVMHTRSTFWHRVTPHGEAAVWTFQQWFTKRPVDKHALHAEISGLKEWMEEGEAKWPKETEGARTARGVTNVLRAVQLLNLALKLEGFGDPNKGNKFESSCEVAVAILDTVEAFEGAIEPQLEEILPKRVVGASLKFTGALAGFIHSAIAFHKIGEATKEGKRDLLGGYKAELVVYLTEAGAGLVQAGIAGSGAEGVFALTLGAVASALCFVSFAGAIVVTLYQEGKKRSVFQRFVNHSAFGLQDDPREQELWASGRWFSSWKNEPSGLKRQRETLTMLFANFSVVATDRYSVDIRLGATPPGMKLKVTFTHGDQEFPSSFSHRPEIRAHAVIDPFAKDKWDVLESTDGDVNWEIKRSGHEDKNKSITIHIGSRPKKERHLEISTLYCYCDAQLVFESARPGQSEVAIPPETPLRYVTMQGSSPVSRTVKSSLPEPD